VTPATEPATREYNDLRAHDLTAGLDGAVCAYGNHTTVLLRSVATPDGLQTMSSLEISPHAVTHVDLAGSLTARVGIDTSRETAALRSRDRPDVIVSNCVLVDLRGSAQVVHGALSQAGLERIPQDTHYWCKDGQLAELLLGLRLRRADVEWLAKFPRAFVVFCTYWRQFAPAGGDLSSRAYVPWHPFLLHPYLDESAAEYLLVDSHGPQARGVGCDIYGLDSPLRYLTEVGYEHPSALPPEVAAALEDPELRPSATGAGPEGYWPLHVVALGNDNMLLEQLRVPTDLLHGSGAEQVGDGPAFRRGRLVVFLMRLRADAEAALASAFFVPDRWCEDE